MRRTGNGLRTSATALLAALTVVAALGMWACSDPLPRPAATLAPIGSAGNGLWSDVSSVPVAGPDLGEAWTTEPDPDAFITLDGGSQVAPDQFLVMLARSSTRTDADRVAASIGGTIGGHIAYIGLWKVLAPPLDAPDQFLARRDTLAAQAGVLSAAPVGLVIIQAEPNCAPGLDDQVYAGSNSAPYDLIGVKTAWQAFYASGLPVGTVHIGIQDTVLTRDPQGRIPWEFDDVTFIGDPQTTTEPNDKFNGHHHNDGMLGFLAGSGQNGGIVGIDSVLGDRLLVSHDVLAAPVAEGQSTLWTSKDGITYSDAALIRTIREIESGATIINGSWGAPTVENSEAQSSSVAMWKTFFAEMASEHPKVLFVYSAGNDNKILDGTNYWPAGIPAPNVITVGNIANDGGRFIASYDTSDGSNGVMPGSGGEITLGAPGDQAVWGIGLDGQVDHVGGGTSSATPMVTATAALIRSLDPTLSAAKIKQMIADSAAQGDPEVGGKTLRVDRAVRAAIDGVRARQDPPLAALSDDEIASAERYCQIDVTSELKEQLTEPAGSSRWEIRASIDEALQQTTLSLLVDGGKPSNWRQAVTAGGQPASWDVLVSKKGAWAIVTRADNGFWVKFPIREGAAASPSPLASPSPDPGPSTNHYCDNPPDESESLAMREIWALSCGKTGWTLPPISFTAPPTQQAGPTVDCSNMPEPGTIAYAQWALKCKPIAP